MLPFHAYLKRNSDINLDYAKHVRFKYISFLQSDIKSIFKNFKSLVEVKIEGSRNR